MSFCLTQYTVSEEFWWLKTLNVVFAQSGVTVFGNFAQAFHNFTSVSLTIK